MKLSQSHRRLARAPLGGVCGRVINRCYRPYVEMLEARLPPGDLWGGVLSCTSLVEPLFADATRKLCEDGIGGEERTIEIISGEVGPLRRVVLHDADNDPRYMSPVSDPAAVEDSPVLPRRTQTDGGVPGQVFRPTWSTNPALISPGLGPDARSPASHTAETSSAARPFVQGTLPTASEDMPIVSDESQVLDNYGKLPLSFEPNVGQTDAEVDFVSRAGGYTLFLSPTEAVFAMPSAGSSSDGKPDFAEMERPQSADVLRMQIMGGNSNAQPSAQMPLAGRINYLIGNDPSQWHTDIPTHGRVEYDDVYPGIDMAYYGKQQQLEYDFIVAPGADPELIELGFAGADSAEIDSARNLVLKVGDVRIQQEKPYIYQEINGTRQQVAGAFSLSTQHAGLSTFQVAFEVGAYDASLPLVIDPVVLSYSSFLGGSYDEIGYGIGVDAARNAYVAGYTASVNFPKTSGAFQGSYAGGFSDAFVTKMSPDGSGLVYSTYLGGVNDQSGWGEDKAFALAVDPAGNAYVTGLTTCTDFPTTPDAFDITFSGGFFGDAFVTKLNPSGSALVYSTYLGGVYSERALGIAVDTAGNAHVTGVTDSFNFPTTAGAYDTSYNGGVNTGDGFVGDSFVTKLTAEGSSLVYSTFVGGSKNDIGRGIAVDRNGNASIVGNTNSSDLPTTSGVFQPAFDGGTFDAFVAKLTPVGSGLVYVSYLGGNSTNFDGEDIGYGIASDRIGNVYVTGSTQCTDFPITNGAFDTTLSGSTYDAFVTKVSPNGASLIYSTYLGGSNGDEAFAIAVDRGGRAYVTGRTSSTNFPVTPDVFQPTFGGWLDVFVTKFLPSGSGLVYSSYLGGGGSHQEYGYAIALDRAGSAYLTGVTESPSFPTTQGAFDKTHNGGIQDAFVAKVTVT